MFYSIRIVSVMVAAIGFSVKAQAANYYRCEVNNRILYQAFPCQDSAQQHVLDSNDFPKSTTPTPILSTVPNFSQEEIIVARSPDTHFHVNGTINGVKVDFLIDTGATELAIPESLALSANLLHLKEIEAQTAGGETKAFTTSIRELKVGNFQFKDVAASIINGQQALLGMSILSHFDLTQKDDNLSLKVRSNYK
ncbi:MAG: aspartyl protease [Francisellaceae bacterium]|nr:aspartyl protease [Francisellaceae bacterium]